MKKNDNMKKNNDMSPEDALKILGGIPLAVPSHPHLLNLPDGCDNIQCVQNAYKVVEKSLENYKKILGYLSKSIADLLKEGKSSDYIIQLFGLEIEDADKLLK